MPRYNLPVNQQQQQQQQAPHVQQLSQLQQPSYFPIPNNNLVNNRGNNTQSQYNSTGDNNSSYIPSVSKVTNQPQPNGYTNINNFSNHNNNNNNNGIQSNISSSNNYNNNINNYSNINSNVSSENYQASNNQSILYDLNNNPIKNMNNQYNNVPNRTQADDPRSGANKGGYYNSNSQSINNLTTNTNQSNSSNNYLNPMNSNSSMPVNNSYAPSSQVVNNSNSYQANNNQVPNRTGVNSYTNFTPNQTNNNYASTNTNSQPMNSYSNITHNSNTQPINSYTNNSQQQQQVISNYQGGNISNNNNIQGPSARLTNNNTSNNMSNPYPMSNAPAIPSSLALNAAFKSVVGNTSITTSAPMNTYQQSSGNPNRTGGHVSNNNTITQPVNNYSNINTISNTNQSNSSNNYLNPMNSNSSMPVNNSYAPSSQVVNNSNSYQANNNQVPNRTGVNSYTNITNTNMITKPQQRIPNLNDNIHRIQNLSTVNNNPNNVINNNQYLGDAISRADSLLQILGPNGQNVPSQVTNNHNSSSFIQVEEYDPKKNYSINKVTASSHSQNQGHTNNNAPYQGNNALMGTVSVPNLNLATNSNFYPQGNNNQQQNQQVVNNNSYQRNNTSAAVINQGQVNTNHSYQPNAQNINNSANFNQSNVYADSIQTFSNTSYNNNSYVSNNNQSQGISQNTNSFNKTNNNFNNNKIEDQKQGKFLSFPYKVEPYKRGKRLTERDTVITAINSKVLSTRWTGSLANIPGLENTGIDSWVLSQSNNNLNVNINTMTNNNDTLYNYNNTNTNRSNDNVRASRQHDSNLIRNRSRSNDRDKEKGDNIRDDNRDRGRSNSRSRQRGPTDTREKRNEKRVTTRDESVDSDPIVKIRRNDYSSDIKSMIKTTSCSIINSKFNIISIPCHQDTLNSVDIMTKYPDLYIPADFVKIQMTWNPIFSFIQSSIPNQMHTEINYILENNPATLITSNTSQDNDQDQESSGDPYSYVIDNSFNPSKLMKFNARVVIDMGFKDTNESIDRHYLRNLRILLGRKKGSIMLLGGSWSSELDGGDPLIDRSCLINTARRSIKSQSLLDIAIAGSITSLGEIRYHRPEETIRGKSYPEMDEITVIYFISLVNYDISLTNNNFEINDLYKNNFDLTWANFNDRVNGISASPLLNTNSQSMENGYDNNNNIDDNNEMNDEEYNNYCKDQNQDCDINIPIGNNISISSNVIENKEEVIESNNQNEEKGGQDSDVTLKSINIDQNTVIIQDNEIDAIIVPSTELAIGEDESKNQVSNILIKPIKKRSLNEINDDANDIDNSIDNLLNEVSQDLITSNSKQVLESKPTPTPIPTPVYIKPLIPQILLCPQPITSLIKEDETKKNESISLRILPLNSVLAYTKDDSSERLFEASVASELVKNFINLHFSSIISNIILSSFSKFHKYVNKTLLASRLDIELATIDSDNDSDVDDIVINVDGVASTSIHNDNSNLIVSNEDANEGTTDDMSMISNEINVSNETNDDINFTSNENFNNNNVGDDNQNNDSSYNNNKDINNNTGNDMEEGEEFEEDITISVPTAVNSQIEIEDVVLNKSNNNTNSININKGSELFISACKYFDLLDKKHLSKSQLEIIMHSSDVISSNTISRCDVSDVLETICEGGYFYYNQYKFNL